MCMEDITIGRRSGSSDSGQLILANTPTLFVPRNARRIALLLPNPQSGTLQYSLHLPVGYGEGFILFNSSNPMIFNISQHGDLVRSAWYIFFNVGGQTLTYQEVLFDDLK